MRYFGSVYANGKPLATIETQKQLEVITLILGNSTYDIVELTLTVPNAEEIARHLGNACSTIRNTDRP